MNGQDDNLQRGYGNMWEMGGGSWRQRRGQSIVRAKANHSIKGAIMIRKHVTLMALAMLAMFAVACGGGNNSGNSSSGGGSSGPDFSTPKGTLTAFQDAFNAFDAGKLEACYTAEVWKEKGEKKKKELEEMKAEGIVMTLVYDEADIKIDGDSAKIEKGKEKFKMKDGKEEEENMRYEFKKVEGKWKLSK